MTVDTAAGRSLLGRVAHGLSHDSRWLILVIAVIAVALRLWRLDTVPPGWRDDELINNLVISQKVLDGDWAFYYADASGHESLYHILSAATLALFGPGVPGIRLLPAILGTITVILTYLLADRLFGRKVAFLAAICLAVSFWSLMYSRIGIRHISLPVFMLGAFYAFWRGLTDVPKDVEARESSAAANKDNRLGTFWFILAGLSLGVGFYTYFASRGVPVILLIFCLYLALFQRTVLKRRWKGVLFMFGLAAVMSLPLVITLMQQPDTEARVEELAVPLVQARDGDFTPLRQHIVRTLSMFHGDGDDEWLYNIPFRPVFGPIGAVIFWLGVLTALWYALKPVLHSGLKAARGSPMSSNPPLEAACAFVLIWWLVGISPGFISVPAASLGHTIIAQSAVYILVALPLLPFSKLLLRRFPGNKKRNTMLVAVLGALLIFSIALRDLPDYFQEWPSRGMTRFLYRAEIKELAGFLNEHQEMTDFGVTGLLAGPWDRIALEIDIENQEAVRPRWYNPDRVVMLRIGGDPAFTFIGYPDAKLLDEDRYQTIAGQSAGEFQLASVDTGDAPQGEMTCFTNGLCLLSADYLPEEEALELIWFVSRPLDLPSIPLISNPPPPGVYAGPRLSVFAQSLNADGELLVGDDGFWVDVLGLRTGDQFLQSHNLALPNNGTPSVIVFGLYDPMTGERIPTENGRDRLSLQIGP